MTEPIDHRDKKGPVGDIGRCIYCGAHGSGVKLTKEHIIPLSLGCSAYLKNASCVACAKITRDFETHVARNIYGHLRILQGVETRHSKERPSELPIILTINGAASEIALPVDKHPFFLILPTWKLAGFFRGEPPNSGFSGLSHHSFYHIPDNIRETLGFTVEVVKIGPDRRIIDPAQFARAIAKIAYCTAIEAYGFGSFKPLAIRDLILGKYSAISYFVGTSTPEFPPPPEAANIPHLIKIECAVWQYRIPVLIGYIRLFANSGTSEYGMPIYQVLIGIPSPELRNRMTAASAASASSNAKM